MPADIWAKLIADTPILAVLLLVLWKGGEKLDKLGDKFDKMTLAVKGLSSKVDLVGRLQDLRLELHEERTSGTGKHNVVTGSVAASVVKGTPNGSTAAPRGSHPSWHEAVPVEDDELS